MIEPADCRRQAPRRTGRMAARHILGVGGAIAVEGAFWYLHPTAGAVLAITEIGISLLIAVVLVATVLFGSDSTCERVFRLLRWIANRPEPPVSATSSLDATGSSLPAQVQLLRPLQDPCSIPTGSPWSDEYAQSVEALATPAPPCGQRLGIEAPG